ncbi:MAG: response regulator [Candidatus Cloacimonetes bacterium]|nr:response regulator [Candidatus Cloacimonadota bacterium]
MNGAKILIVDDHYVNRMVLEKSFSEDSYQIASVESGEDAIDYLEREVPDLIFLDIMMPGLNGYEVCERIKKNPKTFEIPVIFLTALDDKESRIKGLEYGAVDFITKPFDIFEVKLRAKQHLKIREMYLQLKNHNNRVQKELQSAQQLQLSLLPENNIELSNNLEFSYEYLPCESLGGDFLDIIKLDDFHYCFYMADVSGHGVASSLVTVFVKQFFHRYATPGFSFSTPAEMLKEFNKSFHNVKFGEKYLTLFVGIVNTSNYEVTWSFAGPNTTPMILSQDGITLLESKALPVGWFENMSWQNYKFTLPENSTLFLYSDAAIEIRNKQEDMLDIDGLKKILVKINFKDNPEFYAIVNELLEYSQRISFDDDLTFFILRRS